MDLYVSSINCYIHVMMYSYYFVSSFPSLQKYTKYVKSFVTLAQIAQLLIVLSNFYVVLKTNCHVTSLFYLQSLNVFTLLALFTNFYVKSYMKKSQVKNKTF